jgi:uncharacterized protein YggE
MNTLSHFLQKAGLVLGILVVVVLASHFLNMNWGRLELAQTGTITVTGEAETQHSNQIASFQATVQETNPDRETAVQVVNQQMEQLIARLKEFGIAEADLKTESLSLYEMDVPEREAMMYPPMPPATSGVTQWHASNMVSITLRDLTRASDLATLLAGMERVSMSGPNFMVDDTSGVDQELLEEAMQDARQKAEFLLSGTNQKLGKIVSISESGYTQPMPYYREMAASSMDSATVPVEPGSQTVYQTVMVVFEIAR